MRRAGTILIAALMMATFTARAIQVETSLIATTNGRGKAVILSTVKSSMIVRTSATAAPVKAKLVCLNVRSFAGGVIPIPPLPPIQAKAYEVTAAGKSGGMWYYLRAYSAGPLGETRVQDVLYLGITATPTSGSCNAGSTALLPAVGIATYI
jgi:hypothetical protein